MNLWAISDLHVGYEENRRAVDALPAMPDDWLILAGDTGETPAHLDFVLRTLQPRFAQVIWTVGNHDLWTPQSLDDARRGDAHYRRLVRLCQTYGVLTPEDPYAVWPGDGPRTAIVPTFALYNYTFRPDRIATADAAVAWAAAAGVRCADEDLLSPAPYESRQAWSAARVTETEARLSAIPSDTRIILINHWPLRREHAVLPRIPRFSIWCGTRATEDWHTRYPIDTVVYGHLHMRATRERDGVRFEEVSLGYPKQWNPARGLQDYLRLIR
ncbi:MAG TPA: metallophosphoesterase [Vicinamibacterales bacterium]|nr:metallophosphoesterase [Vicinamibacterales bacterium]